MMTAYVKTAWNCIVNINTVENPSLDVKVYRVSYLHVVRPEVCDTINLNFLLAY
jgi:hypothetical protein